MLPILPAPLNAKLLTGAWAALLWCAAAASATFWVLSFPSGSTQQGLAMVQSPGQTVGTSSSQWALNKGRALGVQTSLPEVSIAQSSRFQLWGVVAGTSGKGSALIAVDGQPPRAFRVGQTVADHWVLQSLGPKQAQLGATAQGFDLFTLKLPGSGQEQ